VRTRILPPLLAALGGALIAAAWPIWKPMAWRGCTRCVLRGHPCTYHQGYEAGWDGFAMALDHQALIERKAVA
jgi:hypothetical protein